MMIRQVVVFLALFGGARAIYEVGLPCNSCPIFSLGRQGLGSCQGKELVASDAGVSGQDQVGQLDWRRDHVGVPTSSVYAAKKIVVATEKVGFADPASLLTPRGRQESFPLLLERS